MKKLLTTLIGWLSASWKSAKEAIGWIGESYQMYRSPRYGFGRVKSAYWSIPSYFQRRRQENCKHNFVEVYAGTQCFKCDLFYPDGQEPWMPEDESPYMRPEEMEDWESWHDDDYEPDEYEEAMDACGQTADGWCQLAGTEFCDFECKIRKWEEMESDTE